VYSSLGQDEKAIELYGKHLAIAVEVGDRAAEGRAYDELCRAYNSLGHFEKAIEFYHKALAISR
jgi:tetratricopeptide (TPR) repeat protein